MSTAVIKSIQVAGSTSEVLAVVDDGFPYRVQTDGTLASLKAALQQATTKASDRKTKPEIFEGMTVDFTPVAARVPTAEEQSKTDALAAVFAFERSVRQQARYDALPPELQKGLTPEDL